MMQGSELRAIREAAGLDQQQFGERLGLSRVTVGLMERGQKPIEPRTALLIENSLRMRIDVAYSRALAKWTVTLTGPGHVGVHRVHEVRAAEASEDKAVSIAQAIQAEEFPLALVMKFAGPIG